MDGYTSQSHKDQDLIQQMYIKAQDSIQSILNQEVYSKEKTEEWGTQIISKLLLDMKQTQRTGYKFVATCLILSKNATDVIESQMALWDLNKDVRITTKWANESILCALSLWGFKTRLL